MSSKEFSDITKKTDTHHLDPSKNLGDILKEARNHKENDFKKTDVNIDEVSKLEIIPRNGGSWSGEPGNSDWIPNKDEIPGDRNGTNTENKTWEQILSEYGVDHIRFKDGEPDFSEVSKGNVEIDDFSDNRDSNFSQADEKLAEQRGCTPEEVAKWRQEHKYTWHECSDCKTMQKVPTEIHGNIPHSGGISVYKNKENS
ncbi:MAG: hypothetical protein E7024_12215 [Succinivibrio dextrinosolvens]|nr:hypothetical protein [Succinivibrio dextrinosolvens]